MNERLPAGPMREGGGGGCQPVN